MNSLWPPSDHQPHRNRDREAILLAVLLLHLIALMALLTMLSPSWPRAIAEPALILLPEAKPADPAPLPPKPSRHAGGSPPAASARETIDTSRALIPTVGFAEPVPAVGPAEFGQAPVNGIAAGTGIGTGLGAGTGSGNGGTGAGDRSPPLADTAPAWVRRINDEELRPLLGGKLKRRGVAVSLLLSCEILLNTRVRDCRVKSETPPGSGVAGILPQAARYFRIAPARRDGRIIDGERVEILWQVDIRPARKVEFILPPPF